MPARFAQDGAGRILHRRDGVDVFGPDAAALKVLERGSDGVNSHAVAIERDPNGVHAQSHKPRQRTLIALLLDKDGISRREQHAVDEVEPLQRARGDEDLVRRAGDAGSPLELVGQKFPQRAVTERAAFEPVAGERSAFALEHGGRRGNESIDRHLIGIVVAADEVVFGASRPPGCGRRQAGCQERREVERCDGHALCSSRSTKPSTATAARLSGSVWQYLSYRQTSRGKLRSLPRKRESRGHGPSLWVPLSRGRTEQIRLMLERQRWICAICTRRD